MAIYHCSIKIGGRSKGQSAVAASAYRSASKITDKETGVLCDFSKKSGVVYSEVSLCANAPNSYSERENLWNEVHKIEKNKNAQLWREIEVALPREFGRREQIDTMREYVRGFVSEGMCADWSIHDKGDGNTHSHIMLTTRPIKADGKWGDKEKKDFAKDENGERIPIIDEKTGLQKVDSRNRKQWKRVSVQANDWNDRTKAEEWRERWSAVCNKRLSAEKKIDHRSYKRRGIENIPTIHEGYVARNMERSGEESDRCNINREIRKANREIGEIWKDKQGVKKALSNFSILLEEIERENREFVELSGADKSKWLYWGGLTFEDCLDVRNLAKTNGIKIAIGREVEYKGLHMIYAHRKDKEKISALEKILYNKKEASKEYETIEKRLDKRSAALLIMELRKSVIPYIFIEADDKFSFVYPKEDAKEALEIFVRFKDLNFDELIRARDAYYIHIVMFLDKESVGEIDESVIGMAEKVEKALKEFPVKARKVASLDDEIRKCLPIIHGTKKQELENERGKVLKWLKAVFKLFEKIKVSIYRNNQKLDPSYLTKKDVDELVMRAKNEIPRLKEKEANELRKKAILRENSGATEWKIENLRRDFVAKYENIPELQRELADIVLSKTELPEVEYYYIPHRIEAEETIRKTLENLKTRREQREKPAFEVQRAPKKEIVRDYDDYDHSL